MSHSRMNCATAQDRSLYNPSVHMNCVFKLRKAFSHLLLSWLLSRVSQDCAANSIAIGRSNSTIFLVGLLSESNLIADQFIALKSGAF